MGLVKFKGVVVYQGPLAAFNTNDGWNNSMAEYYPTASVHFTTPNGELGWKAILVNDFVDPNQRSLFEVVLDDSEVTEYARIVQARKDAEEAKVIRVGKDVVVVSGRKVPIGTEGRVFWMGDNKWGKSVGIEEVSGKRHFTSIGNVQTLTIDMAFEIAILKEDKK